MYLPPTKVPTPSPGQVRMGGGDGGRAGYPLHRAHTIREVAAPQYYMGFDPGVRPVVRISRESSYLRNPTQTTDPEASPHNGFYRHLFPDRRLANLPVM